MEHPKNGMINQCLDDVAIAIEVLRRENFAAAAQALGVPTSTVSRRVSRLEATLGVRLLERTSRQVRHTEQGKLLLSLCSGAVDQLSAGLNTVKRSQHTLSGTIRVTAPVLLGNELFSGWFTEFMRDYPDVTLELVLSNRNEDLMENQIDLAIRLGPLPNSEFIGQHLLRSHFVLCAKPGYCKTSKAITAAELENHTFLLMPSQRDAITLDTGERHIEMIKPKKIALVANDIALIREATLAGRGISCLPRLAVENHIRRNELANIAPQTKVSKARDIYAFYPSRQYMPEKVQRLLAFVKEKCQDLESHGL